MSDHDALKAQLEGFRSAMGCMREICDVIKRMGKSIEDARQRMQDLADANLKLRDAFREIRAIDPDFRLDDGATPA